MLPAPIDGRVGGAINGHSGCSCCSWCSRAAGTCPNETNRHWGA